MQTIVKDYHLNALDLLNFGAVLVLLTVSNLVIQRLVVCHAGALMEAMFMTPDGATADNSIGTLPDLPVPVNYPQYNSLALLPLDPSNNYTASVSCLDLLQSNAECLATRKS